MEQQNLFKSLDFKHIIEYTPDPYFPTPNPNDKDETRHGYRRTILRIIVFSLSFITLLYISSFTTRKMEKFQKAFNKLMNSSFVEYLKNHLWLIGILITILCLSTFAKLVGISLAHTPNMRLYSSKDADQEGYLDENLRSINSNHDFANLLELDVVFAELTADKPKISCFFSITGYSIKKSLIGLVLAICLTSLICSIDKTQTWMGFHVVPEFIQKSNIALAFSLAIVIIIATFFLINRIIDGFNLAGKTIVRDGNWFKTKDLQKGEKFNRHIGKIILDKIEDGLNYGWRKIHSRNKSGYEEIS